MTKGALGALVEQPLSDILQEKYLAYALSTITSRSLPDVRDGMKPVHRRLLFAMQQLQLRPNLSPKKCARVVGDVIGKFHPHGDQAVYDALVRLAQDFSVRYPLVDGQGNFGNIDGDNAAAMRYTEARLTAVAEYMLQGIESDAVDFRATYDGETIEPVVLPAAFPNLLANGANGIAVGMATSIPPHNVDELSAAMLAMIDGTPTDDELVDMVPGPDFPTGGILVEPRESVRESYIKGRGSFRLRARWSVEELKGGTYQIVVTEIPYQVAKARLVEKIAELLFAKKLPLLDDVRDESTEDVRLVLIPKSRNVSAELLMEQLFRQTDLEVRFPLNLNVLEQGRAPKVMGLREALQNFLSHRQDVLQRVSRHRLGEVDRRLEVLGGYLIAYLNLDEVIRIIREEDEPKAELMRTFDLTDVQAEAILNMRLRSLRKLEEMEIRKESEKLSDEKKALEALLSSEARQWKAIRKEIEGLRKAFGKDTTLGARRTTFAAVPTLSVAIEEAAIEREPVTVICSAQGWIRTMKGHGLNVEELKYKDGDEGRFVLQTTTADKLLLCATNGKFFTLAVDKLPAGRGFGEPVRLMIDLPAGVDILTMQPYAADTKLLLASTDGRGFVVTMSDCFAQTKNGRQVMTPDTGAEVKSCIPLDPSFDHVAVMGTNRKLLVFPLEQLPQMARGKGVGLQKYKEAHLEEVCPFNLASGLTIPDKKGRPQRYDLHLWVSTRASIGKLPPTGWPI